MHPTWLYLAAAAVIAGVAFVIGQVFPGMGVAFVALVTTGWTAFSVARQRKAKRVRVRIRDRS